MNETYEILFSVTADSIEAGDQVVIEDDLIEVRAVIETDDLDEVIVVGYNNTTGDVERFSLYADDEYGIWSV